ncbi:membrane-associated protein, putative [Bodo saltans]|uniref:Membrane-associated protein, putative n=1 Tax=Bodo saltans TaxID=75058 RepID=A0A0S4KEZ8_BODSA|nr:membrane-associated protein, putative [Bodo saltans]|eukprot:CUI14235.1 membrane-associated protein, putative [Bodo saltans]
MLVSLFGIRYVPGLPYVDTRYIISYAFVIVVPMAVFLVVRYLRERQLRKMFLTEIQLEVALEQQREMSAWHEMLLVPWVPLPVEEQLRLLRTASDHLWGLQENTFVGVVQLANFGPWVMQAGACEAARALSTVVATMDKYYEILSPLAVSVLKCHLDGDRYALVAPRSDDAGLLSLILLAGSYEFSGYHLEHINGCPELHIAVTCGVLGVAGMSVSGTLIPVGQPMELIQRMLSQQSPHRHRNHLACSLRMTANVLEQSPALKSRLSLKLEPLESLPHLADEAMVRRVINRAAVNIGDLAGPHGQTVTSLLESDLLGGEICTTDPLFTIFLVPLDTPHGENDWIVTPLTHIIPSLQVVAEENTTAFHQSSSTANTLGDSELTNSEDIAQRVSSAASMPHGLHKADVNNPAHRHSQRSARDRHEPRDSRHLVVSNFSTARKSFLLLSFVDADVERRFREHSRDFMSWPELMASSVGAAATALILIIICVMYGNTAVVTVSPLPFAIAALVIGVALVGCAAAHQHQFVVGRRPLQHVLLVLHEFFFVCFYAMIVGADYSAEPQTSAAGDTQLVWLLILFSLNVVRPRVHGVAPHLLIDVIGCVLFVVQALLYPYPSTLMRWLNVLGDVVTGLGSVIVNTSFDFESRQRFFVEVSLEQLHSNLIILNEEINKLLASTRANNPAAIFLSRSEARRAHQRARRRRLMNPFSPLCIDNIDPSTSTTRASRVMDRGVLLLEFVPLSSQDDLAGPKVLQTTSALRAGVVASKAFLASVAGLLESQFKRKLRIVKATPTTLLVLTDVCVLGRSAASEAGSDLALLELGLDVVRVVCPRHGLVGRAVADSGPMIGVLLGTSSISFEFTGPVIERSRGLLRAAPWGACFATRRLLRYCGVDSDAAMPLVTPCGLRGRTTGQWESWRVRGQPKVSVAPLIL